jgi:hypothetical protein
MVGRFAPLFFMSRLKPRPTKIFEQQQIQGQRQRRPAKAGRYKFKNNTNGCPVR